MRRIWRLGIVGLLACNEPPKAPANTPSEAEQPAVEATPLPSQAPAEPQATAAKELAPGVFVQEHSLEGGRVWIYTPSQKIEEPIGCVLVAPAGSDLITGMNLSEGDRPEHVPYVRNGFIVVAYDIAGAEGDGTSNFDRARAVVAFRRSGAGIANAEAALDFALERYPTIDRARIYTAGHSSAATLSLLVAARDDRVKAAIAYAPVVDVGGFLGQDAVDQLDKVIPGYRQFIRAVSPLTHKDALASKPIFLFHAKDDEVVPPAETAKLFSDEQTRHRSSQRLVVDSGGHYDAMVQQGIPAALEWLATLERQ